MDEKYISDFQPIGAAENSKIKTVNEKIVRNPYTRADGLSVSSNLR